LATLLTMVVLFVALALLWWSWNQLSPTNLSTRFRHYRAQKRWLRGMANLSKGNVKQAEQLFAAAGLSDELALVAGLGAAYAAYRQGKADEMSRYLHALEDHPQGGLFSHWLKLKWQAELTSGAQVTAELEELVAHFPDNPLLRELAGELAAKEHRWQDVRKHGRQAGGLPEDQARQLWLGELTQMVQATVPSGDKLAQLAAWWKKIPKAYRADPALVAVYAETLLSLGKSDQALTVVSQAVEQRWDERYEPVLWALSADRPGDFLLRLDGWIKQHAGQPVLLLLAGRVAMRAKLWGRAETLFTEAGQAGSVSAWAELARLKQAQGDGAAVQQCLLAQSRQVSGHLPALPLPNVSV